MYFGDIEVVANLQLDEDGLVVPPKVQGIVHVLECLFGMGRVLSEVNKIKDSAACCECALGKRSLDAGQENFSHVLSFGAADLAECADAALEVSNTHAGGQTADAPVEFLLGHALLAPKNKVLDDPLVELMEDVGGLR